VDAGKDATPTAETRRYPLYVRKVPRTWWMRAGPYRRFAAREITSMFAAGFSVLMLLFLFALARGPEGYAGFLRWLRLPIVVAGSCVILVAIVYHTATWFRLTSRILVIRLSGRVVPPPMVIAVLVVTWIVASALVAYFHVWF
jgi:fumarate reductase subunit C